MLNVLREMRTPNNAVGSSPNFTPGLPQLPTDKKQKKGEVSHNHASYPAANVHPFNFHGVAKDPRFLRTEGLFEV